MKAMVIIILVGALAGCNQKTEQEKHLEILTQPYTKPIPLLGPEKMKLAAPPNSTPAK